MYVCCFTNTSKVNQDNLQATSIATMPTRTTTTIVKIPTTKTASSTTKMTKNLVDEQSSRKMSTTIETITATSIGIPIPTTTRTTTIKKTSTNIFNSAEAEKLSMPFRRSHSVPIIKFDDVTRRKRVNSMSDARIRCDNKHFIFNSIITTTTTTPKAPTPTTKTTTAKAFSKNQNYKNGANQLNRLSNQQRLSESIAALSTTTTATITTSAESIELKLSGNAADDICIAKTPTLHDNDDRRNRTPSIRDDLRFGCAHYKRRAMFVTPCCNKFYKCRLCHDESESHHFDRKTLNELICSECNTRQKVQEACISCGVRFGKYTCLICNLFDDEDKKQYHCDACGICRIGGAENFFHCEVCNMCLPIQLQIEGHKCVENISRSHCPVCLGDIHTSRIPCHIPDCGHLLHKMCFDQLLASGHYACPTCQTSLIDMSALWDFLDAQALKMPMPKKYENQRINIFCNDCQRTSKANFHFIGLKCLQCGAYNTTQDIKRRVSLVPDEPNTA